MTHNIGKHARQVLTACVIQITLLASKDKAILRIQEGNFKPVLRFHGLGKFVRVCSVFLV